MVASLSVLRVHGAYLPVDEKMPQQRLEQILSASGARGVISDAEVLSEKPWLREHGYLVEEIDADGVRAQLITPPGPLDQGTLVAFHGGGFIVCSAATHAKAFGLMGAASRLRVLNVDYRLAPEHRFPAAHDDCLRATRWAARALHRDVVHQGPASGRSRHSNRASCFLRQPWTCQGWMTQQMRY